MGATLLTVILYYSISKSSDVLGTIAREGALLADSPSLIGGSFDPFLPNFLGSDTQVKIE